MSKASIISTGLLALPHVVLMIQNRQFPRATYIALLSISLAIVFMYSRSFENGGPSTLGGSMAALLMPVIITLAISLNAALYSVNNAFLSQYLSMQFTLLGTPLGQVKQYRLNEVVDRFRKIVTTKINEDQEINDNKI